MATEHLDFLLNLDSKLDGMIEGLAAIDRTTKALSALDRSTSKMSAGVDKLDKASHHAAGAHAKHAAGALNLGHAFEGAKNKAHGLLEALGLIVVFEGLEKIAEKVMEIGSEMINAAAKAESFDKSFKLALGAEGGTALLEYIEHIAKFTDKTDDELKGMAGTLVRVGFAGEKLKDALAAAGDLGALPAGNMEESLHALTEIKRKGTVNDRLLAPLGLGEKEFLKELSVEIGVGVDTIKKRIEKGTFDTELVLGLLYKKIQAKTNMPLGGALVEKSKGLEARMKHLKDLPDQFMQGLSKTEGYARFSEMIGKLLVTLDPSSPTGKKIFDNLDKALTRFVDVLAKIDVEKLSRDLISLFEKLPPLIGATTSAVLGLTNALGRTAGAYGQNDPKSVAERKERLKEPFIVNEQKKPETAFERFLIRMAPGTFGPNAPGWKKGHDAGAAAADGLAKGLGDGVPKVEAAVDNLGDKAEGGLKDKLEAHSPSRVFERIGRMAGEGYQQGLDASMGKMTDSVPAGSFAAPAGGAPFGPIQVAVNITTNVGGAGVGASDEAAGEAIGEKVAAHVEALLPSALASAFERMGQEAGS